MDVKDIQKLIHPRWAKNYTFGDGELKNWPATFLGHFLEEVVWRVLGVIAVFALIYGGYLYLTAAGNPEQVEKAKKTLIYAIIGIVVVLLLWAILSFLKDKLGMDM